MLESLLHLNFFSGGPAPTLAFLLHLLILMTPVDPSLCSVEMVKNLHLLLFGGISPSSAALLFLSDGTLLRGSEEWTKFGP